MNDQNKTKRQLIEEVAELRRRNSDLEEAGKRHIEIPGHSGPGGSIWQSLVANTPIFILILDGEGRIRFANRTDSGATPDQIIGKALYDFCRPEDRDRVRACVQDVFQTGRPGLCEGPGFRLDDQEHWYASHFAPIFDNDTVIAVSAISINITEQKRAEEAIQRAHDELERRVEERTTELSRANEALDIFRRFAESSGEGFGMSGFDGRIVYVNPTLCRLLGETRPEDVIGKSISTYYPPEYVERRQNEMIPALLREGVWNAEQMIVSISGKVTLTQQSTFLIRDESGSPFRVAVVISDITERKQAEEALAESEAKYRQLVETTDTGYLILDAQGRVIDANAEYVRLTGYHSLHDVVGRRVVEWTAQHDAERNAEEVTNCLQTGKVRHLEVDYVGRDGQTIPVEINANVIFTKQGSQIISLCRDVTERRRANKALQQAHDELQAIYDGMVDGLLVANVETKRFVRANPAICTMLGYSEEELLSLSVMEIHPKDELPSILHAFEEQAAGRRRIAENLPVLQKDGSVFYADIATSVLPHQDHPCMIGIFRDVTERKRAEDALKQAHEELQAIYEGMFDGLLIADLDTKQLLRANPAICQMLGYSEAELLSMTVMDTLPAEDIPTVLKRFEELAAGRRISTASTSLMRRDGTVLNVDIVSNTLTYQGRACVAGFFHDVTDRKRAQEALEREHRTLKHLLQSSDHERQMIAYEIHDGLAQQLAGAVMQIEAYSHHKDREPKLAADAFHAGVTMLRQSLVEARGLINGVRPPILDESGIVAAVAHLVNEERHKRGPKIEYLSDVEFERLTPLLENAIYRIVQEGLANACRHSQSEKVRVALVQQGDRVRIEVQDYGVGFKVDAIEEGHFGVAGIRERARLLGGSAVIDSEPGIGTWIVVELPIVLMSEDDE